MTGFIFYIILITFFMISYGNFEKEANVSNSAEKANELENESETNISSSTTEEDTFETLFNSIFTDVHEDALLKTPELIKKYGYPVEVHHVQTEDGYILEMHRIPHGIVENASPRPAVIVQHGLLCSSADWIVIGPKKGLGYLLADLGYDVWLGNARGNTYSRNHVGLSPEEGSFWDFSWHEIGIYDLPAMIDYVLHNTSQSKVYYIGHSQGTTSFYVMCSMRPGYNNKIRAMIALSPIAYMYHLTSPLLKFISKFDGPLEVLGELIGIHEFLPSSQLMSQLGGTFCRENTSSIYICSNVMFLLAGFSEEQLNSELLPVIVAHAPAGASTRQLLHYAQNINHKNKFRQYDFGLSNLITYMNPNPPSYNISKISAPVAIFYSQNDWLAAEVDVMRLYKELDNPIGCFLIADEKFNHLDFTWGKDVVTLVYDQIFSLLAKY